MADLAATGAAPPAMNAEGPAITDDTGGPMTDRVALYLQDAHPIREGMEHARYAEARGFEAVWQAESRLVREATVPMAAFASVTERIKVGSGVADCWSRNPARLAATFATLDDLAPGRILLGLGAWWDPLARKVGIDRAAPADGHAGGRRRGAGPAPQRDRDRRRRRTSTSTGWSSTTSTRSGGPRTSRSTSARPGCR